MSDAYGASQDDWEHWSDWLWLTEDLLPVVCQPGLTLAPTSTLTSYGKTPSRFDQEGRVVGFPKWTSYHASNVDVARWSADSRLGICLQTRQVRALDVDIEDFDAAQTVREVLNAWAVDKNLPPFPIRFRQNSAKWLALFQLEGEYGKQVLQTAHGPIELLMNGQQCLIAGAHPSGARYEWEGGLPERVPVLTDKLFEYLKNMLQYTICDMAVEWTEGRVSKRRDVGAVTLVADPVLIYLASKGDLYLTAQHRDRVDVRCPWAAEHTSKTDASSTSYFPAGTGGFECGHFRCLHAHCTGRLTSEFLEAIGFTQDGFENLDAGLTDAQLVGAFSTADDFIGDPSAPPVPHPIGEGPHFPASARDKSGLQIKPLLQHVVTALRFPEYCGIRVSRDTFKDAILVGEPGQTREFTDEDYVDLTLRLVAKGFGPGAIAPQVIRDAVAYVAKERAFDSAIDWLTRLAPWDGTPRVNRFCADYLGTEDTPYATAVSRYWWTAHAGRVLVPGVQADMAIVLISTQGTGKTSTIKSMVPTPDEYVELSLSERDSDLCRAMRGKLIGELAELRGIASREMEAVKAWVSCRHDSWTPKYKEFAHTLPRRIILVGTSNQEEFLADETGNRRWLPIHVGLKQDLARLAADREQLWAEAHTLFSEHGILWRDAERLARAEHYKFEVSDPWAETIRQWLAMPPESNFGPLTKGYLTVSDVLQDCFMMDATRRSPREMQRATKALATLGYQKHNKRIDGIQRKVWIKKELDEFI